jgi:hypothetical protein
VYDNPDNDVSIITKQLFAKHAAVAAIFSCGQLKMEGLPVATWHVPLSLPLLATAWPVWQLREDPGMGDACGLPGAWLAGVASVPVASAWPVSLYKPKSHFS